jgi:hypothetical protein
VINQLFKSISLLTLSTSLTQFESLAKEMVHERCNHDLPLATAIPLIPSPWRLLHGLLEIGDAPAHDGLI